MPEEVDPLHEEGTHHWIITLSGLGSRSGTCTPAPGESRYALYLRIRSQVLRGAALEDGVVPVTLFFDLRENEFASKLRKERVVKRFLVRQFVCMDWPRRYRVARKVGLKARHDWLETPGTEAPILVCQRCELTLGF